MYPLIGVGPRDDPGVYPDNGLVGSLQKPLVSPLGLRGGLNHACFNFTGSNYANISELSTNLLGGGGSFTVAFLVKGALWSAIACAYSLYADDNNRQYLYWPLNSSYLAYMVNTADGTSKEASCGNSNQAWTNVYIQTDVSVGTVKVYINGSLGKTLTSIGTFGAVAATPFILGNQKDGVVQNMRGQMADIRVYSAVVTPNHNIPMTQEANGVAWHITPKADGSIVDSLGNGNTLTTTGDSLYGASGGPGLPWWPV